MPTVLLYSKGVFPNQWLRTQSYNILLPPKVQCQKTQLLPSGLGFTHDHIILYCLQKCHAKKHNFTFRVHVDESNRVRAEWLGTVSVNTVAFNLFAVCDEVTGGARAAERERMLAVTVVDTADANLGRKEHSATCHLLTSSKTVFLPS